MSRPETTLTDVLLAGALFDAGLAPHGVIRIGADTYIWNNDGWPWEPWCDIRAVWHLVGRYGLTIIAGDAGLKPLLAGQGDVERPGDFAGIPAAISRMSLRLRHAELAHEVHDESVS